MAKQKALYHFRRTKVLNQKVLPAIKAKQALVEEDDVDFSTEPIRDRLLQMLFAVCRPALAGEAQMGLALRVLCGFGIDEIAEAFFTRKETVGKRLACAKEKLRTENAGKDAYGQVIERFSKRFTGVRVKEMSIEGPKAADIANCEYRFPTGKTISGNVGEFCEADENKLTKLTIFFTTLGF